MIQVSSVYKQGSNPTNEDAYVEIPDKKRFAVIDGATGLGGLPGKVAAETIQKRFYAGNPNDSLMDTLCKGNADLAEKTKRETGKEIEAVGKEKRSTCGIAAVQFHETYMEYIQSGDCMIFVAYQSGETQMLTYDHVMRLDQKVISDLYASIAERTNQKVNGEAFRQIYEEEKEKIVPTLVANRMKMNTINGYSIIDGTEKAIEYVTYGRIPLHQVEKVLMLTDGLQLHGMARDFWKETADFAFQYGVESLLHHVVEQEETDKYFQKYPRLKHADDKTGMLLEWR